MKTLHTHSRTSPQGVLTIAVPVGLPSTDVDVVLVVSEAAKNGRSGGVVASGDAAAWNKFVDETAGAWRGELVRPPRGENTGCL